ncbi:phospho-N-acetylmuramoyl-pentapeptide-transferase [Bombilactobacillus bombi]|uniref:Phospho-N-acetylmuramoyl-pentapeptide-transferase n=1 Tax=Bombilactobacillus bombi TaxID=1303590 RepID=A0A347SRJ2_9LACO|nr:phospho-N-acetylmuramoyl-pentapeptide-transferase [Bombilactobacillus bombi]AXX64651.1 phospho-N-acetylmuramoyl-pentapeptide-transferase [Bombilactobacillus bombi]MCO6541408.1 phospho-N-acetylmuramoyl-pentapeptide-transferase [Lactobacillus sp.]RHW49972.1 phospho-N-acetylmuramoyl-pentapeptide-transferase [Bombilactobacillus bombi]
MENLKFLWPLISSFAIVIILMPLFIKMMVINKEGQQIREEGPSWQQKAKAGTPTMGGLIFLIAILATNIWTSSLEQLYTTSLFLISLMLLLFGLIGFLDDFIKLKKKRNLGLYAWQKSTLQLLFAIVFVAIYFHYQLPIDLQIGPFILHSAIIFILFLIFWIVGFSNAVNLTDGLDGLVAGLSIIAFATYAYIAYKQQNMDILLVCVSVIGAMIAFLLFNHKPAKIFMGDVGSLALGATLAAISILLGNPWSLIWIGIVFVLETASVIIQVAVFKITGKRVFKMSPIHHHFEMSGWSEWKVVAVFWIVGLLASISYLLIFVG